jgi:hypothetical protein
LNHRNEQKIQDISLDFSHACDEPFTAEDADVRRGRREKQKPVGVLFGTTIFAVRDDSGPKNTPTSFCLSLRPLRPFASSAVEGF